MRYLISILTLLCIATSSRGGDFESGGIVYSFTGHSNEVAVDQYIVAGQNSYKGIYIIPSTVNYEGENYVVASINDMAFAFSKVTEVVIPNSVRNIGEAAFSNANDLTDVTLPLYIDLIPEQCFSATSIVDIAIPEGVTEVSDAAFSDCINLHTVILPTTLKYIGTRAFSDCHNLYEIYCAAAIPPIVDDRDAFDGVRSVDLVVSNEEAIDEYLDDEIWGEDGIFTMFPNEDVYPTLQTDGQSFAQDWQQITLGNDLAYKVYDESGELIALTSASHFYLAALDHDANYTIIPTTLMSDSDPTVVTVDKSTGIEQFIDDAFPAEPEPIIIARQGTLYIYADACRRLLTVWDMSGRLYFARMSNDAQVIDLPRNRVYIVKLGNYVKKVFI